MLKDKRGLTLVEILVALAIIVMLAGVSITTIATVQRTSVRKFAEELKVAIEETRDLAMSHGGDSHLKITRKDGGVEAVRTSISNGSDTKFFSDRNATVLYKRTEDDAEEELEEGESLEFNFAMTSGAFLGPDLLDYITITNGYRDYDLIIIQKAGTIEWGYELEDSEIWKQNAEYVSSIESVASPSFVLGGVGGYDEVELPYTGTSQQPELFYNDNYIRISGTYRAIEKGTYTITFKLKDPSAYSWADGSTADKHLTWSIVD